LLINFGFKIQGINFPGIFAAIKFIGTMKKILGLVLIAGMFAFTACGPSAEEKAAAEKAVQDSIAAADAQRAAEEEAARAEQAMQDSIAAAAAAADTTAATPAQ
jgi:hypothetical protein